jgi:hypothetical protein
LLQYLANFHSVRISQTGGCIDRRLSDADTFTMTAAEIVIVTAKPADVFVFAGIT